MKHAANATIINEFGQHIIVCGTLTTEHPASSYNKVVFVGQDGGVLGNAECAEITLGLDLDQLGNDPSNMIEAAQRAGYNCTK